MHVYRGLREERNTICFWKRNVYFQRQASSERISSQELVACVRKSTVRVLSSGECDVGGNWMIFFYYATSVSIPVVLIPSLCVSFIFIASPYFIPDIMSQAIPLTAFFLRLRERGKRESGETTAVSLVCVARRRGSLLPPCHRSFI